MLRKWLTAAAVVFTILVPRVGPCNDTVTFLELTGANSTISYSDEAAWGWWNVSKYDEWRPEESTEFGVVGARMMVVGTTYGVFVDGEWYQTLQAAGSFTDPDSGEQVHHDLTADIEVYDLAFTQWFGANPDSGLRSWFGVTHMRIDETRTAESDGGTRSVNAASRLWGLGLGADGHLRVGNRLGLSARLAFRWAEGDRDARVYSDGSDGSPVVTVELSDDTSRTMYGVDLGVRWLPIWNLALEAGWWYRDWQRDGGPARFNGPYFRVIAGF